MSIPPADFFVSYAREDLPFVQRLVSGLRESGLEGWMDVRELYAGEEYWPEIARGIDAAATLVFVISPESAASPACRKEIEHAASRGKRILSVCRRDVDASCLPEAAATRHWVFAREQDDAAAAFEQLARAIRADWAYLRELARLLVKAAQWHTSGDDGSMTLRGRELRAAKAFLSQPAPAGVEVTGLHEAFLETSLRARRRRIRTVAAAAAVIASTTIALGWSGARYRVGSLNNLGSAEIEAGSSSTAIEPLERAEAICRWLPFVRNACDDVAANLVRALLDVGEYDAASIRLSRLIDGGSGGETDPVGEARRASALMSRAYAFSMLAESRASDAERAADYERADRDVVAAEQAFAHVPDDPDVRRLDITRARVALGRGSARDALAALQRVSRYRKDPDIEMLLFVTYRCLGDGAQTIDHLGAYMQQLDRRTADPHWLRNQEYIERLVQRCPGSR